MFGQDIIDTIPSDLVFTKKINGERSYYKINDSINPLKDAIIIRYKPGCEAQSIFIKEIADGHERLTKRFTYFPGTCNFREKYYTSRGGLKFGTYEKWYLNGSRQIEGKYDTKGNKDGVFIRYDNNGLIDYYIAYNKYGKRVCQFTADDSLNSEVKSKNFLSVDIFCLKIKELKLSYERYLGQRDILKFEIGCKQYVPEKASYILTNFFSNSVQFIGIAPKRYLFSIEKERLFGYRRYSFYLPRHPFYFSCGLFYLYKSYEKLIYYHITGEDEKSMNFLRSESSSNIGIKFLLGKKIVFGKTTHKVNEVLDGFIGVGLYYRDIKRTEFGCSGYYDGGYEYGNPRIMLYDQPEVTIKKDIMPTFFIGLRFGIGW